VRHSTTVWVPPFLLGALIAAVVAWVLWPDLLETSPMPPELRALRELGSIELAQGDRVRAIAVPNSDGSSFIVCVIYTNEVETLMQCPASDAIHAGDD